MISKAIVESLCLFAFFHISPQKKCAYRSKRTKNANSDSRQTNRYRKETPSNNCLEFAFLSNSSVIRRVQKRAWYARAKKVLTSDSVSLALTVYHTQAEKTIEKGKLFIFPKYEKSLSCEIFFCWLCEKRRRRSVCPASGCARTASDGSFLHTDCIL